MMKTLYDIIWSDFIYDDVEKFGKVKVYGFSYFPSTNSLYITLCGIAIENDFAVMEEIK